MLLGSEDLNPIELAFSKLKAREGESPCRLPRNCVLKLIQVKEGTADSVLLDCAVALGLMPSAP